ncbi:DUF4239 domain-containing protein [Streptantibioticus rubrisoli]|uniref:DUF4239 domain-containing protein n=1 Tax=Streptantibioticus rubrisoli TaxID=1387313 RepID=A0ABT1PA66_9ACTN|nr:DUF4239 domain-containing protein [Streptantibioticus rubrisoli]MCQ4041143.1 DUF4239 domain-containing protein [Streptantibioticus rubrisoli]
MFALLSILGIVLGGGLVAVACVVLKHRVFPPKPDEEPREALAEYISMMVGVIYALVLGLALVSVWDTHSSAEAHVQSEAGALHQVYLLADALPPAAEQQARAAAVSYAHQVTSDEWSEMTRREPLGPSGWQLLNRLRDTYETAQPTGAAQQNAGQEAMAQLSVLDEARRGREADAQSRLSSVLWAGLLIGGVLTVGFMFLFGVQRRTSHLVMVMGLTGFIVFLIVLIHQLDMPFGGALGVDAEAFTRYFPGSSG